jgi:hypothetical protein
VTKSVRVVPPKSGRKSIAASPPALVVVLMQKWFVKGLVDSEK